MKAGIITCHDVYNFGSSLQALALQEFLNNHGIKTEIINYKPSYLYKLIDLMEVDSPKWKKNVLSRWCYRIYTFPFKLRWIVKYIKFKWFNKHFLILSSHKYTELEINKEKFDYDVYICGSDQIWNSKNFSCGEDSAFFLKFVNKGVKIAYAASFGGTRVSKKGEENIKRYLPQFRAVSVREKSGLDVLEKYRIEATHVIDPVFLLDKNYWRNIAVMISKLPKTYILVYGYDNSEELSKAVQYYSRKTQLPVISIKTRVFQNAGPLEFIALIDNAAMVITTSFHAVAFSVILHTPFVACKTGNEDLFERISNLLEITELNGRKYSELFKKNDWETESIDFNVSDNRIRECVEQSKKFLLTAVKE